MWALNWLPDIFFHLILVAGVLMMLAGRVLRMVPFIATYGLPIQVVGLLLSILGVWYEGGIAKDAEWKAQVAELQIKVAQAETKAATVNTQVVEKVVTRTRVIKEKADTVVQYIDREVKIIDESCKIPPSVIRAHDAGALNQTIDSVTLPSTVIVTPVTPISTAPINKAAQPQPKKSWRDYLTK